ncbi:sickle tail protein-like [Toxotes jaculatrix]|uniref:sickle tail protein-like n=1 Tax=Toxotes jaculatrix TaxID=941984 RepID=UPI001B3B01D9|nr:sickle tail protein-like [Toxotes jaculatrix]
MSEGEVLPPTVPFLRGCKARASLPVGRSSGQPRERPLGVLYLQYGEETKQIRMPDEISSRETLQALFVTAFPHQLTMKMLQSPSMAIYIKDTSRNVYYDLEDVRNITSHSCLKVYHKDPAQVFIRHARPASTEGRISKEMLYGSHSPVHTLSSSNCSTLHGLQGSMSPPMVRSMPSSPSRKAYGGGSVRGGGPGLVDPGSATLPWERLPGVGRSSTVCTSSSVILERRDVKPDEDAGSSKSMALVVRGEGGPHYPDSYCSSLQDGGGGRSSFASSQCSAPPSLAVSLVDAGVAGIPGGLQQYRASIKPLMGYRESMDHSTCSLHRQKSRKYGESQFPPLGTKTSPASPHRVSDVRMIDGQITGGVGLMSPERMSPIRRSLRRDSNGGTVEIINRSRGGGSSSSASSVFVDSPQEQPERLFQGHVTASNDQSERMKAMEEQLASLAGLVHHALSMGSDVPGVEDTVSENAGRKLLNNRPVSSEPQNSATLIDGFSPAPLALQASDSRLQHRLVLAKKSVCELRLQLSQLRDLQLSNQETVSSMLRMAGQELMLLMCDRLAQSEEAAYRRRAEMEEERIHYLAKEDRILKQISEVEDYVDRLQRSSASSPGQLSVTLRDVEEGAVGLRRVGEALAALKGEFPELQVKMRSLLRMEVEAVRFLKEEPHKMDSMLKRVKALTDGLSSLRRCVSESASPSRSAQVEPLKVLETDQGPMRTPSPKSPPKPPLRSSVRSPLPTPALSGSQAEVSQVGSASPVLAQRMMSTAATVTHHHQHHHPSPPLKPTHGQDSPTVAKVSPRSREGSPALQRRLGPPQSNGTSTQGSHTDQTTVTHTQTHTETTEGSLSGQTSSTNQSSGSQAKQTVSSDSCRPPSSNASTDVHRGLQEAQASLMESIPNLNVSDTRECPSESASGQNTPLDLTVQASVEQQQPDTQLSDEIISSQLQPSNTAPAASSQPPAATATPPPSAASSAERGSRPPVEKPRRSSVDKEMMKQSADRAGRSPPPPPRRVHAVNAGLTTGRSGEVTFTTRKDMAGAQDEGEKEKPEKDRPVVPQPKPPRQLPEVKPKPQMCVPAPLALVSTCSTPATASAHRGEEEEEEEEDSKFMKEVQVTTELSNKNDLSGGNKQWKGQLRTSSTLRVANQKPSDSATCEHQSAPRSGNTDVSTHKLITAAGLEGLSKEVEVPPPAASRDGVPRNGELPPLNQKKVEKMEALRVPTSPKENDLIVNTDEQNNREFVGNVRSPTTAENKVKFTTVVTLKKGKTQGTDLTCPDQTSGKAVKEVPAEKRSNLTVIVTLQKENGSTDSSPTVQQDKSLSSDQEGLASPLVQKPSPPSPGLTHSYSSSSRQQSQDAALQAFRNQSLFTEEGGSLSPDTLEDEGPPPPPPVGKISLRISKTRVRSQSKQEDLAKMNGSDPQTVSGDSTGESAYLVHENQGFEDGDDFDKKPIIVIFNEPMDTLSAYKRLSTIFECEEDLDGILSPESIVAEEQTQQEEDKQDVRKLCISEINTRRDVTGNGQNHLHQRPSAGSDSVHGNQNQGKADLLRKTETKRKFKFKFPKNKLAAISQAIRTGSRTGKKTLEVVVLEEEEEMASDSKPVKENEKQTKESKMSHTNSTKYFSLGEGNGCDRDLKVSSHRHSKPHSRVEKLCQSTSNSIDSLEESIKQLGISVDSITAPSSPSSSLSSPPQSPNSVSSERAHLKRQVQREREKSPSKRPAPQILKGPTPPQSKRVKPQPPHDRGKTSSKRQTSSSSSSSSALRPHSKSRHSSGSSGSPEKTPKGQQQAAPKQPSQPRVVSIPR